MDVDLVTCPANVADAHVILAVSFGWLSSVTVTLSGVVSIDDEPHNHSPAGLELGTADSSDKTILKSTRRRITYNIASRHSYTLDRY